jgi:hypothetical protein
MVAQPLSLLYCEEGTTPENEELADALAAAVAATSTAAAQAASGSSSSGGLALWQQHALLQLKAAGEGQDGAGVEQQQLLLQLLGDPADLVTATGTAQGSSSSSSSSSNSSSSSSEEAYKQQQQQQQQQQLVPLEPVADALPSADRVLQIVHANCTGGRYECCLFTKCFINHRW